MGLASRLTWAGGQGPKVEVFGENFISRPDPGFISRPDPEQCKNAKIEKLNDYDEEGDY